MDQYLSRKNYRHHAVNTIWTLLVLDRYLVSDEEIIEGADFHGKFKSMSSHLEIDTMIPVDKVRLLSLIIDGLSSIRCIRLSD